MFKKLAEGLILVTDAAGFEAFLEEALPVTTSVMTDLNKQLRPIVPRPTEYPTLVTSYGGEGLKFTAVSEINKLVNEANQHVS